MLAGAAVLAMGDTRPAVAMQAAARQTDPADSLWRQAAISRADRDYRRAAGLYKQFVTQYPKADRAGEALYWRAWALYQLGSQNRNRADLDEAIQTLGDYADHYGKDAQMAGDVTDLHTQIRSAQAALGDATAAADIAQQARKLQEPSRGCSKDEDDIRAAALQGLTQMNSSDAVSILKQVLARRDPCRAELRKTAVYLLAQRNADDVVGTLLDVARNDPSRDVRSQAIYYLSTTRSDRAAAALDSILFSSTDNDTRNSAVYALSQIHSDRAAQALKRAAQDERMPDDVRGTATYWLGNSRLADLAFFRTLYTNTRSHAVRDNVIQAVVGLHSPDAMQWLLDVAKDKAIDRESRKTAIYWAGQQKTVDLDQLMTIYEQARGDNEVQSQVIYVLSTRPESGAIDKLMTIAKGDSNVEMRKSALYWLGTKNDPRVRQFLLDIVR
jgi:HEAT repeat protein